MMKQDNTPASVFQWLDNLKFNRFHLMLMVLTGVNLISVGCGTQIMAYVIPPMLKEWGLTPVEAGQMASYGFLGNVIGSVGFGILSDQIGRKKSMILALLAFSLFSGASYFAPGFKIFCVLRLLAGLGLGGALPLSTALISEFAPTKIRAKAITGTFMGFTGGWVVAALVPMVVNPLWGWRMVFLLGFIPLLFIPVLWVYLPESVRFLASKGKYEEAKEEVHRVERLGGLKTIAWTTDHFGQFAGLQAHGGFRKLFSPRLIVMTILVWLSYFFTLMAIFALSTWLPHLLIKSGFSMAKSFSYGVVQAIGAMVGGISIGYLMDAFGRKAGLLVTFLLGGLAVIMFGMVSSPVTLYAVGALIGVFVISSPTMLHVVAAETYPTEIRATGAGWAVTVGKIGAVVAPLLGGVLHQAGLSFSQFCMVWSIPCFICVILVLLYRVNVRGEALETATVRLLAEK
ncbi:MAG: putative niacin/nicotinamide transporter NaiP [Syntrophorhabdus sp. PtaU1.Bin153]|nr:MAG: putative niacin/nicotinamide transporter NaiP [Syntrophorhabdus sp. PtaU1.Bin153]